MSILIVTGSDGLLSEDFKKALREQATEPTNVLELQNIKAEATDEFRNITEAAVANSNGTQELLIANASISDLQHWLSCDQIEVVYFYRPLDVYVNDLLQAETGLSDIQKAVESWEADLQTLLKLKAHRAKDLMLVPLVSCGNQSLELFNWAKNNNIELPSLTSERSNIAAVYANYLASESSSLADVKSTIESGTGVSVKAEPIYPIVEVGESFLISLDALADEFETLKVQVIAQSQDFAYNTEVSGVSELQEGGDESPYALRYYQAVEELQALQARIEAAENNIIAVGKLNGMIRGLTDENVKLKNDKNSWDKERNRIGLLAKHYENYSNELKTELESIKSLVEQTDDYREQLEKLVDQDQGEAKRFENSSDIELRSLVLGYRSKLQNSEIKNKSLMSRLSELELVNFEATSKAQNAVDSISSQADLLKSQAAMFRDELKRGISQSVREVPEHESLVSENVYAAAHLSGLKITGSHKDDWSTDVKLVADYLRTGDGRCFRNIQIKLLNRQGDVGIELRPGGDGADYLTWQSKYQDDYGFYFSFYPNGTHENSIEANQFFDGSMSALDKITLRGICYALIRGLRCRDVAGSELLTKEQLVFWRMNALELQGKVKEVTPWLNIQELNLVEYYHETDYSHLWLDAKSMLSGCRYFSGLEFKLCTDTLMSAAADQSLTLEFRDFNSSIHPLDAWPPNTEDEFGVYLRVKIALESDQVVARSDNYLSENDKELIGQIVKNSVYLVRRLADEGADLSEDKDHWIGLLDKLSHEPQFLSVGEEL